MPGGFDYCVLHGTCVKRSVKVRNQLGPGNAVELTDVESITEAESYNAVKCNSVACQIQRSSL